MRYVRNIVFICCFLAFSICSAWEVRAEGMPIPCILSGEDVGNGYEYTAPGIGSFSVNGMEGKTLSAAVFSADETCTMVFYRDGERTEVDASMILDPGQYELRLYRSDDTEQSGDYGTFVFTIENDFASSLEGMEVKPVTNVENPELKLRVEPDGMFRYTLPDGEYFRMNVPQGGWSRSQVTVELSDNLRAYVVRRDGVSESFAEGLQFAHTGSYEILVRDNEFGMNGETSYTVTICFVLYPSKVLNLSHVNAPMGLSLVSARHNGTPVVCGDRFIHLEEDGSWMLEFADSDGIIRWQMEFERDTTPPLLRFSQEVDGKVLTEPAAFTISELTAQVLIKRNGEEAFASLDQIAANGVYHIEVTDQAGNVRDYDFTMAAGQEIDWWIFVLVPVIGLLAAAGIIIYWKDNIRVV